MALIDKKLTDLTEKLSVPDDAFIHIVDVSDTSQSPQGSSYKARKSTISGTVKAQSTVSGTVKTNSNSSDPIVYLKSEVDSLVAGKQNALGFTPENVANKQSNLDEDLSGQKYPNVTAVKTGLSTKADTTALNLKADKSNTYTKLEVDNLVSDLDIKDVIEVSNFASLPLTGELEKIYITIDDNKIYRFNGTIYVPLGGSLTSTATENFIPKVNAGGNLNNSSIYETPSGIIGIGTTTPSAYFGKTIEIAGANGGSLVLKGSSVEAVLFTNNGGGSASFGTNTNHPIDISVNGLPKARFHTDDSFTVGTTTNNGQGKLQVNGPITASPATLSNQVVVKSQLDAVAIPQLESNATDLTVWNNGKGNAISNTTFGEFSLRLNSSGVGNTALGYDVLSKITASNGNTAVGSLSLSNATSATNCTAIGSGAGQSFNVNSPLTNASSSIFIGGNSRALGDNQTNQIVIGVGAVGAGSNTATLGDTNITRTVLRGTVEAGNGTANNHLVALGQIRASQGWANYADTQYTSSSPFSVASGTTVTLPNNAGTTINTYIPSGVTSFYNSATSKITPNTLGDAYTINVRFNAKTSMNNDFLEVGIDIGNPTAVTAETKPFLKGANTEQKFNFVFPVFSLATFLANGGLIKVTSGSGTLSIYNITYFITRTYKAI